MWGRTDRSTAEHTAQRWGCTARDAELFQKHFVLLLRLAERWGNSDRTHLQNPNPDGAVISSRKRSAAHICAQLRGPWVKADLNVHVGRVPDVLI